ncbi:uncharacterized protein LOC114144662 [Xiphophorus couchianus]|uniref:uncharacterized protein LOC114144662 n=1 Tax=Xiphophorus couchianus TaxID=32473 RepID=UPI001016E336|nr:uncharacterized protein LOC114144662 [Xiphophorus couchianus]
MLGEMGISWRTALVLVIFITFLQIRALMCDKPTVVSGTEGQMFDFICEYPSDRKNNTKHFCCLDIEESFVQVVRTSKHNEWTREGRVSLYDNTTAGYFIVRLDELYLNDSGQYYCGDFGSGDRIMKIHLNVSQVYKVPASTMAAPVHKLTMQLSLTIILCVGAMIFVCLFTICLLLAAKHRRSTPRQKRETSSDYETMMPSAAAAPEPCGCSHPDCIDLSALPRPPSDLYSCFTEEHRESTISCSLGEYVDVDVLGHICQYQLLDRGRLENHVYHSLHGSCSSKQQAPKEQIVH